MCSSMVATGITLQSFSFLERELYVFNLIDTIEKYCLRSEKKKLDEISSVNSLIISGSFTIGCC